MVGLVIDDTVKKAGTGIGESSKYPDEDPADHRP